MFKNSTSNKIELSFITMLIAALLMSCGDSKSGNLPKNSSSSTEVIEPKSDEPAVQWSDYSPAIKIKIDDLTQKGDCFALQNEFDNADANNDATMARTGHNNAQLMGYIDFQMRKVGCY